MTLVRPNVHLGLVHHPVRSRDGSVITTSVTNLDVHDIARASRTFAVRSYSIITPIEAQRKLVEHILGYWNEGDGAQRVPERANALSRVQTAVSIEAVIESLKVDGVDPLVMTTAARGGPRTVTFSQARARLQADPERAVLILFGTGYGLTDAWLDRAEIHLEAVCGTSEYNHLAVRSAVAIVLDRLLGIHN